MDATPPSSIVTSLTCTQCGGELHPDEGQAFVTCPYCSSTVYVDKSRVVFHWYLAPTLDDAKARGALARWMAGNQTVKDLDKKSRVVEVAFSYFPMWLFKRRTAQGKEEIYLEPAAATSVSELKRLRLPAGDLKKYVASIEPDALAPSVPLQAATDWLNGRGVPVGEIAEQSLVHIPIFTAKYAFQNKTYTAIIEAGTGEVLANIFPAKAETPYLAAGCATAVVFLCLATFPVIGGMAAYGEGALIGLLVCSVLGVIAAPLLFMLAAWVAAKV